MGKSLIIIIAAIMALAAVQAVAAPVETGNISELIDVERAAYLRDSVCTQVSSFDRTGGNDDGFSGVYSFIRKEGDDFVIFDEIGPGCVYRLWSANAGPGWVKFYFDGEAAPRVQFDHFEDMFTNVKYPFVPPFSQHFLGGWASYLPLPFTKSLKIVAQGPVRFLQIDWRQFPSADGITTFDPNFSTQQKTELTLVKKALTSPGEPPMPLSANSIHKTAVVTAKPGKTVVLANMTGAGLIRAIKIKAECADTKFLRRALLLVKVDRQKTPNVYSPLGDFFLDPFGGENAQSLVAGKSKDAYYSYWVMPYSSGASIKVKNDSVSPLKLTYDIVYEPKDRLPKGMGRFFAWWHRQNPTINGKLFPILDAQGRGQWCGVSHAMQGGGEGLGFLEGDEIAWLDGRDNTAYNGTGTEDYFCGGWYFGAVGSAPFYGCGVLEGAGKCHAYRIQLTDLVPFQQKATIGIEHGHANSIPADYSGVTFWYAAPKTKHQFAPVPVVDRIDRPAAEPGVVEAESVFDPNSGGRVIDDLSEPFYMSGGRGITSPNGSFALDLDATSHDAYQVEMGFVKGPDRGIAEVSIDGKLIGRADTYAPRIQMRERMDVGFTGDLAKGPHVVTVKSVGRNPASTGGSILLDFLTARSDLVYQGERMATAKVVKGDADRQNLGGWSENAHMFFRGSGPGSLMELRFKVRKSGTYPLTAWLTKAGDYGIVQVKIDGKPVGRPFDGYNDGVIREMIDLGQVQLREGDHTIALELTGKNPKSSAYFAGLDVLSLK